MRGGGTELQRTWQQAFIYLHDIPSDYSRWLEPEGDRDLTASWHWNLWCTLTHGCPQCCPWDSCHGWHWHK